MLSQPFRQQRVIRFSDCDPAAIVFYPQYFVMFNALLEDWVDHGLGIGFRQLLLERRIGLPTVRLEADFKAVSRMADRVTLSLNVERIGGRSISLRLRCVVRGCCARAPAWRSMRPLYPLGCEHD